MEKFLRGPALTEAARDYIKQYILEHHLKEGDPLPSENQIAQELGIGRGSVREAVKALQSLGILEVRHGQGLYVRAYNMDSIFENFSFGMRFDEKTLLEWLQIRTWLESAIIEDSIRSITPEAIAEMEVILIEWAERLKQNLPHVDLDERFHLMLYSGLGNQTLLEFLKVFWIVYKNLENLSHLTPSLAAKMNTLEDHHQILNAIKEGDTRKAVAYLHDSFIGLQKRLENLHPESGSKLTEAALSDSPHISFH